MKRFPFSAILLAAALLAPVFAADEADDEVAARKVALDLAGAFSNDGFKLRDGHWMGRFAPSKGAVVQVNLFAGNEYWFSLGATDRAKKVSVSVFDETGKPIAYEPYQEGASAAAGFSPVASGPYLIKVEQLEGEPGAFCLLYSYK
jgi:hypothetical protein